MKVSSRAQLHATPDGISGRYGSESVEYGLIWTSGIPATSGPQRTSSPSPLAKIRTMTQTLVSLTADELRDVSSVTLAHYEGGAQSFWEGTRDHDVSQNVDALLRHISGAPPRTILDLGCGPGRDLVTFRDLGHEAVGLDGAEAFVRMARAYSGSEVLHQDFLALDLPCARFDGIFANAALFHVPSQELPRVLRELWTSLASGGALFSSNPHGPNREGWSGDRYCCYLTLDEWRRFLTAAGFVELEHYYRPAGQPRHRQPWLASLRARTARSR
jgi:SAM-dependent methyltransferase